MSLVPQCHGLDLKCRAEHLLNQGVVAAAPKVKNQIHNLTQKGAQHQDSITKAIESFTDPIVKHSTDVATTRAHGDFMSQIKENLPLIAIGGGVLLVILLLLKKI